MTSLRLFDDLIPPSRPVDRGDASEPSALHFDQAHPARAPDARFEATGGEHADDPDAGQPPPGGDPDGGAHGPGTGAPDATECPVVREDAAGGLTGD